MIVGLFRSNSPILLILIFIIGVLLWLTAFGSYQPSPLSDLSLFANIPLFHWIEGTKYGSIIIGFCVVFTMSIIVNQWFTQSDLSVRNTYLTAFIYLLLMSSTHQMLVFNMPMLSSVFLLIAIQSLFKVYDAANQYQKMLSASILLSVSSIIYFPSILFVPLIWFLLIVFRNFEWREWVIGVVGFFMPYLYLWFFYFWNDNTAYFFNQFIGYTHLFRFNQLTGGAYYMWLFTFLLLLTAYALYRFYTIKSDKVIKVRTLSKALIWVFFFSLFIFFVHSDKYNRYNISYLAIPLSVFIAHYLLTIKKKWIAELILLIFITFIVIEKFI